MANYTVVGGRGFIGSEIVKQLELDGHSVFVPEIDDARLFTQSLGVVIDCAGFGDCQKDPLLVFNSNSRLLADILAKSDFEKLLYISSNRVYMGQKDASESGDLTILSADNRRLFNLTKLVSEELCLLSGKDVVILRPANVYGLALNSPLFLPAITRNAINNKQVDMYVTPEYKKDYVSVVDVACAACQLAAKTNLSQKIFNVASGINTSAGDIATVLSQETGCKIIWHQGCVDEIFPENDISAIQVEIDYRPRYVIDDLKIMIDEFKRKL
ncbi:MULTISPECIES: NAD-dependent epimerase/dehydratase family protein [unclassified Shewanella]|uniref:NAD-dependent epimerase/dehydratase family protein n=1 Tax=unclassified Shewanella TaxID=196818 RepID=UPI0021D7FA4A|nr:MULTISPECIES: SDR family oxidoreductase [unclassified Shewanella]MCU8022001.1 SDR family oxidoreductase [Shewanella sp. SM78]MCU8079291.1 SDR family oxidoreductase [Shewanella sp. SM103]